MGVTFRWPLRQGLTIRAGTDSASEMALADVVEGIARWKLWGTLGWNDILQRYRRSLLGPFWLTASQGIMVLSLGVLYAELFKTNIHDFLPFLCIGLLIWTFLSSFLTEAGTLFIGSESYIKQIRLPYSLYVFRSAWSKLIILAHNFVIYFAIILYFGIWPGATSMLAIPGLLLVTLNGALASLTIGLISARFRDIPQLVSSLTQIAFANPFYHLVEVVRAPLLGNVPALENYLAVILITALNLTVAGALFIRFRARISYWI